MNESCNFHITHLPTTSLQYMKISFNKKGGHRSPKNQVVTKNTITRFLLLLSVKLTRNSPFRKDPRSVPKAP